ncbi:MAG: hypothetical protein STSR0008_13920 [Ignavibacterium sp.]
MMKLFISTPTTTTYLSEGVELQTKAGIRYVNEVGKFVNGKICSTSTNTSSAQIQVVNRTILEENVLNYF